MPQIYIAISYGLDGRSMSPNHEVKSGSAACTKGTPKTPEIHVEKHLKRLWVRIGESETAEVNQCWSVVASMGQWCSVVGARASGHKKRLKRLRLLGK